jgi:hypothetical protein
MSTIAQESSLFETDQELDLLLDEIQEQTATEGEEEIPAELILRFQHFCDAHYEKVDRIGRFLSLMEWRTQYCKAEAARLYERARTAESKADRTKIMVLYYLSSRGLRKIEGREFTLRAQRNSQDSVRILNETQVPLAFLDVEARIPGSLWQSVLADLPQETARVLSGCVRQMKLSNEAIKQAVTSQEAVPGAEVRRGFHLRVV